jgi:hypothetical protein
MIFLGRFARNPPTNKMHMPNGSFDQISSLQAIANAHEQLIDLKAVVHKSHGQQAAKSPARAAP